GERIADCGEDVVQLEVVHLEIGHRALAARTPVDNACAAIDVALVCEVDEEAHDRARVRLVHGEAVAPVIERGAERAELPHDLPAVIADELPAPLDELVTTEVAVVDSLRREPPHHHRLQRNTRMVVARLPE